MKFLLSSAGAAAVLATALSLGDRVDPPSAVADAAAAKTFRLHVAGAGRSCALSKGLELSEGISALSVGDDCAGLVPEIGAARFWRDNSDGTVTFAGEQGGALIEFAVADGLAYESFRPGAQMVSLVAD